MHIHEVFYMKKALRVTSLVAVLVLIMSLSLTLAADTGKYPTTPKKNNGKKWRLGYLEGGRYINYPINLRELAAGFMELGWMEKGDIPEPDETHDAKKIWTWLARNGKSNYIQFVEDAFWSSNFDKSLRVKAKTDVLTRLSGKGDIDFMIAMGTWAGQDLANNQHSVPTMVMSTSDPIQSKIIKSAEDSGFDHVHAKVDPTRYIRQLRLFHEIIGFKKMGIAYENSVDGRTYSAIADVEKVAKETGFEVIKCEAPFSGVERNVATAGMVKCYAELSPKVDAIYVTVHRGVYPEVMPEILAPLFKHKISSFSQRGPVEVKHGVLLSIARADFSEVGRWHAAVAAKIFNGAKARGLNQIFEDPKKIALNIETALLIGYDPPVDVLGAADEIYEEIAKAN